MFPSIPTEECIRLIESLLGNKKDVLPGLASEIIIPQVRASCKIIFHSIHSHKWIMGNRMRPTPTLRSYIQAVKLFETKCTQNSPSTL